MDTNTIAAEYRLAHWEQIVRAKMDSGMSGKAFCRQEGIKEHIYYYWQRKVREIACEREGISLPDNQASIAPAVRFAEVQITPAVTPHTMRESGNTPGALHVDIPGLSITADALYPTEQLASLLLTLVRSC